VWRQGTSLVEVVDPLEWRAVLEGVVMLGETRVLRLRPVLQGWAMLQAKVAFAPTRNIRWVAFNSILIDDELYR
jgi:hypothetical protein